ncbi:MAG: hypothetical protein HC915_03160 [Anaerolineae bacterium]|nr:hypothetical protein [Anaerolineae bacterium]
MTSFLLLIQNVAPAFYVLAALGIVRGFFWWVAAQRELSWAQFPLERENAVQLGGRGITWMVISVELIVLVWVLSNITYNEFDRLNLDDTEEVAPRAFQTSVPFEGAAEFQTPLPAGQEGPVIQRTQPPSPTPAGTLRPADPRTGCIFNQANIDIPDNGQVIFQTTPVIGTAAIEDFGFYRFEIREIGSSAFSVIGGAESDYPLPLPNNGPLGQVIPQNFMPGEYRFRLVVFDSGSNPRASCEITIFISEPLPTPTPIGGNVPVAPPPVPPSPTPAF